MLARRSYMSRSRLVEKLPEPGSRRWLVHQLDVHTSRIARQRDERCVTCGSRQGLQCSHFYSRRHLAIRFDLRNCNAMCAGCNRRHNSDTAPYLKYMLECYGPEVVAGLGRLRGNLRKVSDEELRQILRTYKNFETTSVRLCRPDVLKGSAFPGWASD